MDGARPGGAEDCAQEGRAKLLGGVGVVADGIFLTFKQLAELVQTYEGFQFDLKIVDSSDELD